MTPEGYVVYCNDKVVDMNGSHIIPTLADAEVRVALHVGMEIAKRVQRKDPTWMLFPFPPFPSGEPWPYEEHDDGIAILIWDYYYIVKPCR